MFKEHFDSVESVEVEAIIMSCRIINRLYTIDTSVYKHRGTDSAQWLQPTPLTNWKLRSIIFSETLINFSIWKPSITHISEVVKFLFQQPNILNVIENSDERETWSRELDTSYLSNGTLFPSWVEEGPHPVRAASPFVRSAIKRHLFKALSFKRSGRDLLREFDGRYQESGTTSFPSLSSFHRGNPSAILTTRATTKKYSSIRRTSVSTAPTIKMNGGEGVTPDKSSVWFGLWETFQFQPHLYQMLDPSSITTSSLLYASCKIHKREHWSHWRLWVCDQKLRKRVHFLCQTAAKLLAHTAVCRDNTT